MFKISVFIIIIASLFQAFLSFSYAQKAGRPELNTRADTLAYILGIQAGRLYGADSLDIDEDIYRRGLEDGYSDEPMLDRKTANRIYREFSIEMSMKKDSALAKEQARIDSIAAIERERGEIFIATVITKPEVVETPSGLLYEVVKTGSGEGYSLDSSWVLLHTKINRIDGELVENTRDYGDPQPVDVLRLPPGMEEAVRQMKSGAVWKLYLKPELGFGALPGDERITPGTTTIVELEVIDFVGRPEDAPATPNSGRAPFD